MRRGPSRAPEAATAIDDPLDLHIQRLGVSGGGTWSKVSAQATLPILTGIALGPQGLALLTSETLDVLQPAVPVALAVLGVTVAFGQLANGTTSRWTCGAYSAAIVLTGLALAWTPGSDVTGFITLAHAALIAILLAGAGWFLSSHGANSDERRVFSIATFLLIGGVADYLSVSSLMLGWVVATGYRLARPPGLGDVRLDAAYVQHPVTALLLVMAGAQVLFSWPIALGAAATTAVALMLRRPGSGCALRLSLTPAAFAVALAMDAARLDERLVPLLSGVVLAASAVDLFSSRIREDAG